MARFATSSNGGAATTSTTTTTSATTDTSAMSEDELDALMSIALGEEYYKELNTKVAAAKQDEWDVRQGVNPSRTKPLPLKANLDMWTYTARGQLLKGNFTAAEQLYNKCVDYDPCDGRAWLGLARLQWKKGQALLAEKSYKDGLYYSPNNPFLLQGWAVMLEKLGKIPQATKLLTKSVRAWADRAARRDVPNPLVTFERTHTRTHAHAHTHTLVTHTPHPSPTPGAGQPAALGVVGGPGASAPARRQGRRGPLLLQVRRALLFPSLLPCPAWKHASLWHPGRSGAPSPSVALPTADPLPCLDAPPAAASRQGRGAPSGPVAPRGAPCGLGALMSYSPSSPAHPHALSLLTHPPPHPPIHPLTRPYSPPLSRSPLSVPLSPLSLLSLCPSLSSLSVHQLRRRR